MRNDDQELATAWARRYEIIGHESEDSPEAKALFWAFQRLDEFCERDPIRAFRVIMAITRLSDNQLVLNNLAAGPLESLLARNGQVVIGEIEREARGNERFRELLGGVWQNLIDDAVWQRIERCRGVTN